MGRRILISLFVLFATYIFCVSPVFAKRVALVISNQNYLRVVNLRNPHNDADLISKSLKSLGFEVIQYKDLNKVQMKNAILDYSQVLAQGVEASALYFAGHGVEIDGANYLLSVDTPQSQGVKKLTKANLSLNYVLDKLSLGPTNTNIIILDACRDNPLTNRKDKRSGLAAIQTKPGTFISYSTAPGQVAEDGEGKHSPFALALSDALKMKGRSVEEVFRQVRGNVFSLTDGRQVPWDTSSLVGDFQFLPNVNAIGDEIKNHEYAFQIAKQWIFDPRNQKDGAKVFTRLARRDESKENSGFILVCPNDNPAYLGLDIPYAVQLQDFNKFLTYKDVQVLANRSLLKGSIEKHSMYIDRVRPQTTAFDQAFKHNAEKIVLKVGLRGDKLNYIEELIVPMNKDGLPSGFRNLTAANAFDECLDAIPQKYR